MEERWCNLVRSLPGPGPPPDSEPTGHGDNPTKAPPAELRRSPTTGHAALLRHFPHVLVQSLV